MRIRTFIDEYCSDIVKAAKERKSLLDNDTFTYDAILKDEYGIPYKVVYANNGKEIPLHDILSSTEEDFRKIHPTAPELEAYSNYIAGLIFLEGEEAVYRIRNELLEEKNRLESYTDIMEI